MNDVSDKPAAPRGDLAVRLTLDGSHGRLFSAMLQKGVGVRGRVGVSIRDFLCEEIGVDPDYVKNRIQTIFLNNRPVDDESAAVLSDGDTLALSASMPGALGATMRKGGFFSPLRYQISYTPGDVPPAAAEGTVTLKLFNTILKDLGGLVLSRGIYVEGRALNDLVSRQGEPFRNGVREILLNGGMVNREALTDSDWSGRHIRLKVEFTDNVR